MAKVEIKISLTGGETRIGRADLFMGITQLMGARSTCGRAKVGCIIVSTDNRIISSGHNGPLAGMPHCSPHLCDVDNKCYRAVHAEANAIAYAAKAGISLRDSTLFCEYAPCIECAKLIVQAGIIQVIYLNAYRLLDGIQLLTDNQITVHQHGSDE